MYVDINWRHQGFGPLSIDSQSYLFQKPLRKIISYDRVAGKENCPEERSGV